MVTRANAGSACRRARRRRGDHWPEPATSSFCVGLATPEKADIDGSSGSLELLKRLEHPIRDCTRKQFAQHSKTRALKLSGFTGKRYASKHKDKSVCDRNGIRFQLVSLFSARTKKEKKNEHYLIRALSAAAIAAALSLAGLAAQLPLANRSEPFRGKFCAVRHLSITTCGGAFPK